MKVNFDRLNDDGVLVIERYLTDFQVSKLNEEFGRFTEELNQTEYSQPMDYSAGLARKIFLKKLNPQSVTFKVFGSDQFEAIAHTYLKEEFDLNKEIFVVEDVPASEHVAQQLHYDVARTLKFFIYLEDTSVENGAFYCVPGSHKWTAERRVEFSDQIIPGNRDFTRDLTDEYGAAIPIEGTAGTLIIFDTDVFHKAGKVSNGRRRVMRGHTRTLREMNEQKQRFEAVNKKSLLQRIISRLS
jgi:ectoine hydroxylase-related dioxygenase (phytanoyl-CoA dioxygenase family)